MKVLVRKRLQVLDTCWYLAWILLLETCVVENWLALRKMEFRDRFTVVNARTLRNLALIDWVNGHLWFPIGYVVLSAGILFLAARRRYPRWALWLTLACLAAPCVLYIKACAYISWKFIAR